MYSSPLAYFITFHTYGTWLHGDERGSVDPHHRAYNGPRVPANIGLLRRDEDGLRHPPVVLDNARRAVCERTIHEVCIHRRWKVLAVNVRTNHVHAVIAANAPPEKVMNDLKSWCTRRMVEAGSLAPGTKAWTRHGSTRYLFRQEDLAPAINYVRNGQGAELPAG